MTHRMGSSARGTPRAWAAPLVSLALLLGSAGVALAEDDDPAPSGFEPGWLQLAGATGKGVIRDGSRGKFREDYNIQSGADLRLDILQGEPGESQFSLRGLGQTGEKQGYLVGEYDSGPFDLVLDLQAWTEYYNNRDGEAPSPFAPGTNNGKGIYGPGLPSVDWFTTGGDFGSTFDGVVNGFYGDFHYRDVNGDMTTLKGSPVGTTPEDIGGPGSVDYSFPGRKKVDYDSYMGLVGGTTSLGNINWQTNAVYQYHDNQAKLNEPVYRTGDPVGSPDEFNRYDEDTSLHLARYDLSAGRHLSSDLYLFGAGFVSYERADPEPQTLLTNAGGTFNTRQTDSSKVTRWTPALTLGSVYTPAPGLVISADTSARGYIQKADLDESRSDDVFFPPGDFGTASSDVDRNLVSSTTKLSLDWKATRRLTVRGEARYQYRWEDVNSRQDLAFSPIEPSEIERWDSNQHRVKVGVSGRYRMPRGWRMELGQQFYYSNVEQDVDRIQNQFIVDDWNAIRARTYLKVTGRIKTKLRAEIRAHYVYEERDNDAPIVQPVIIPGQSGKVETNYWNVSPVIYWLPSVDWSLYANYSISYLDIEPDSGSGPFDYNVLTNSATAGVTWRASDQLSTSASYTFYVNTDDIENKGHNASLSGRFDFNERWGMSGGYRYLGYRLDGTGVDDYDAHVLSLGFEGRF